MEADVAPLLPEGTPVWVQADNAHYGDPLVAFCRKREWAYSISATHTNCRTPVLAQLEGLPELAREDIGLCGQAVLMRHKPQKQAKHPYVVVRHGECQKFRMRRPHCREPARPAELVRSHRGKRGQANAFKGPLQDLNLHHPPLPQAAGQPNLLRLRTTGADVPAHRAIQPAPQDHPKAQAATPHPALHPNRRPASRDRWPLDFAKSSLRLDWIYAAAI